MQIGKIVILSSEAGKALKDRTFMTVESMWEDGRVSVVYFNKGGQLKRDEFLKNCLLPVDGGTNE